MNSLSIQINVHLKSHIRQHQGIRPFVCPTKTCMKSFTRSDELSRHVRIHTGEKRFNCSLCSKGFTRSDHLKKHEKTHRGNVSKSDAENPGKVEGSRKSDKNTSKISSIDDILKDSNKGSKDENNDYSNGDQNITPFHATQNNKTMMGRSGGVVMIRGEENSDRPQQNVFSVTEKETFDKMNEENQPLEPTDNQRYPLANMTTSVLGSGNHSGNRINNPLQEITSYNRAYHPSSFVTTPSYLKQEAFNHNTTTSENFPGMYPSYSTHYGQNRLVTSNPLSNNCSQLFDFKTNEG